MNQQKNEIDKLRAKCCHWCRVAEWFASHSPGTPVPEWCNIEWRNGEPWVDDDLIHGD